MQLEVDFWESIGIPVKDVLDIEAKFGNKSGRRLSNKLNKISKGFEPFVRQYYNAKGETFVDVVSGIYLSSIDAFRELYSIAIFAEKGINLKIIREHAKRELAGKVKITETTEPIALLIPLFKQRPIVLKEIYYENLFESRPKKRFETTLSTPISFEGLDKQKMESILQEYELKRRADLRRPIRLWWFEPSGKIVFRREKNASSQIKLVEKNLFPKTGDEKVFMFLNGGRALEMCSSREPLRTAKIAEYIVEVLSGQKIQYNPTPLIRPLPKLAKYLQKLLTIEDDQIHVLGIRVKNAPLDRTPLLEIEHYETIIPAINELREKEVDITEKCENILNLRVEYDGHPYNLKIIVSGQEAEIIIESRNVRQEDKQKLVDFIDRQLDSI